MSTPTIALFGARGEMGRYLLTPLLSKHAKLLSIDVDSPSKDVSAAWKADLIVLSVPRAAVDALLKGVRLKKKQLVIEICSAKKGVDRVIRKTGASLLSLHPMNGPHTSWTKQKWVIVGEEGTDHPLAQWFFDLLREKHVLFHSVAGPQEHDLLMALVLGLPEMTTVFLTRFFEKFRKEEKDIPLEDMLKITSPAFASLMSTYVHTVVSSVPWLRKDLLTDMHPEFLKLCRAVFAGMAREDFKRTADSTLREQLTGVRRLRAPEEFLPVVRHHVTEDFNLMNALFLGSGVKPKNDLYVQKSCSAKDLLGRRAKIRVGIHGIRGAFTDQAWMRFTSEVAQLPEYQYEVAELVHAANVLKAVEEGTVDIGIFAFANSGSGGYLASIEAMGKHPYDLLALFTMPINMCILTHPSVQSVHELEAFFGHPVALSQCRNTLAQRWPDIPVEYATDEMDTALSAQLLAEGKIPRSKGVFASTRAAEIYGLKVLVEGVHHDPNNATAFAVVRKGKKAR
jgi:prephenate dehydratase/prephenate dehydrogenase